MWIDIFAGPVAKRDARTLLDQTMLDHGAAAGAILRQRRGKSDRKQVYRLAIRMLDDTTPA